MSVGFHAELTRFFHREVSHLLVWFSDQGLVKGLAFSPLFYAAAAELALKRKLSFPVSRIWQRWVRRSSKAVVILASPKTVAHSLKLKLFDPGI